MKVQKKMNLLESSLRRRASLAGRSVGVQRSRDVGSSNRQVCVWPSKYHCRAPRRIDGVAFRSRRDRGPRGRVPHYRLEEFVARQREIRAWLRGTTRGWNQQLELTMTIWNLVESWCLKYRVRLVAAHPVGLDHPVVYSKRNGALYDPRVLVLMLPVLLMMMLIAPWNNFHLGGHGLLPSDH